MLTSIIIFIYILIMMLVIFESAISCSLLCLKRFVYVFMGRVSSFCSRFHLDLECLMFIISVEQL